jgi:hypothetical protein
VGTFVSFLILGDISLKFHPLSIMLAVGLLYNVEVLSFYSYFS